MFETTTTRRQFLLVSATAVVASAAFGGRVHAQAALPELTETDATAAALGYKADTAKVDAAKYPNHKPTQNCANCKLILGADGEALRPCSIFPGKAVSAKGWCAAYAAKA